MATMPYLSRIAAHFNQHFAHWGIQLPPADLAQRRRGQLSQSGWSIGYLFGANELQWGDPDRDDPAANPCESRAWQAKNRRSAALRTAKGFGIPDGAPGVPVRPRGQPGPWR